MSFDWQRYLVLAKSLSAQATANADAEALYRSAVSRVYFGAYCYARNYAKSFLDFDPREDSDDHGRLRAHLKGKRRAGDANRLDQLRQLRNHADYQNGLPWADMTATVTSALGLSERIFLSLSPPK